MNKWKIPDKILLFHSQKKITEKKIRKLYDTMYLFVGYKLFP